MDAFSCRLVAKDELGKRLVKLYHVEAIFDAPSGQYACRLQLESNFNELLSIMKANNVFLELEVGRTCTQHSVHLQFANVFNLQAAMPNGVLDTMSLKLVPGIKVSLDSLHVNDLKSQELHVSGLEKALKKLQVSWSSTQKED